MLTRILFSFLAIFAMLVGGAYFLPKTVEVQRTAFVAAPKEAVFPYLNNLRAFNEWSPWAARDPRTVFTFTGPEEGVGASMIWHSEDPGVGAGRQEIVESVGEDRLLVALDFGERGWALSSYDLEPKGAGTEVTWSFETDLGYNPLNRYLGLFFENWVGSDYELGLKNLKIVTEKHQAALGRVPQTVAIRPDGPYADDMGADDGWAAGEAPWLVRHAKDDYADDMGVEEAWLERDGQVLQTEAQVHKGRSLADAFWVLPSIRTEADLDAAIADETARVKAQAGIPGGGNFKVVVGGEGPFHRARSLADSFWVLPSIRTEADLDAVIAAERASVSKGRDYADDMGTEIEAVPDVTPGGPVLHMGRGNGPAPSAVPGRIKADYADDMGVEIE